jgi:tRNA 2-selenouridine synthase
VTELSIQRPSNTLKRFLATRPFFLDVRAEQEYAKGHFPNSVNAPILTDGERRQVGTAYKQQGPEAALALGHKLVAEELRQQRITAWEKICAEHDNIHIMCWRGGQRSGLVQEWLAHIGIQRPRIEGGFQALRHQSLETLARPDKTFWLLSGRTGSAKTVLIKQLQNSIDLEGRANHRGSAFGQRLTPQPSPITFECALTTDYLLHSRQNLVVEDESRTIGSVGLPQRWHQCMQQADIALLEVDIDQRIGHIEQEYVHQALDEAAQHGLTEEDVHKRYQNALLRIGKRLGGQRLQTLQKRLHQAFTAHASHTAWIDYLLREYYDPMYDYQLSKKQQRIRVRGNARDVADFLEKLP